MATETKPENTATEPVTKSDANVLVDTIEKMGQSVETLTKQNEELEKKFEDLSKPRYPYGVPGAPGIRKGENPLTSRPYSLMRLTKALAMRGANDTGWQEHAKVELELSSELKKAYYDSMSYSAGNNILVPLGADLMPTKPTELEDGSKIDGLPVGLVQKCRDLMSPSLQGFDPEEYHHLRKQMLRKDLSASTDASGGYLVGLAAQGELIEQLKAIEVMSQIGAQQIDLPPQGRIRFPNVATTVAPAATTEAATVSESSPTFGNNLNLSAKPYSGLVDIPDELLRFSTSLAIEAWLRQEFLQELALQTDRDMIYGAGGGNNIKGLLSYSGIETVLASTVATNGDTLEAQDAVRLFAAIADNNAPVDRGFFYACTHTLWGGISTRRADAITANDGAGAFVFPAATQIVGGGRVQRTLNGYPTVCSTQIPTDRAKGAGSDLTCLIGGVGSEWVIARSGVAEIVVTNSDASKFQSRLTTMRGTVYMDAGPRHEASFGMIDDIINS